MLVSMFHVEHAQTFDVNICTDFVHYVVRLEILSWELFKCCAGKEQARQTRHRGECQKWNINVRNVHAQRSSYSKLNQII